MISVRAVLYEGAGAEPLPAGMLAETLSALPAAGFDVSRVRCLCDVAAPPEGGLTVVLGRFSPDTAARLSEASLQPGMRMVDLDDRDAKGVVALCREVSSPPGDEDAGGAWEPWFPVIDRDRCTDCRQCLNFCLFGVFEVTGEGTVEVAHPANCKLGCPACARVCPTGAIVFPKHEDPAVNGRGDGEGQAADLDELIRGDVYATLRRRGADASPRDLQKALAEREQCSCKTRLGEILGLHGSSGPDETAGDAEAPKE